MFYIIILFLLIPTQAFADRVLIRLSDGYPIEYQSGDAGIGTLRNNHPEYKPAEVEERTISIADYKALFFDKVVKPEMDAQASDKQKAVEKIKVKLGLNDSDLEDLREALR